MSLAIKWRDKMKRQRQEIENQDGVEAIASGVKTNRHAAISTLSLQLDLRRLKSLNSITQKSELKGTLLLKYEDEVKKWLISGKGQSDFFIYSMIWLFDTHQYDKGIAYADIAIEKHQMMPKHFKRRDIQTFVADAVFEVMDTEHGDENAFNTILERLNERVWEVYEAILCKYLKRVADKYYAEENWADAFDVYTEAQRVFPSGAKVKTRLAELEKKLAKIKETQETPETDNPA